MNPEIYSILDAMKKLLSNSPPIAVSDKHTHLLVHESHLQVLLAEEAAKSAIKTENATKWMVRLTWAIAILTFVLVLTIFFEFPKITIKSPQNPSFKTEETQKTEGNAKIQTSPERGKSVPNVNK